jgi:hypothetical protein
MSSIFDKISTNTTKTISDGNENIATSSAKQIAEQIHVLRTRVVDMQDCLESLRSTYEVSLAIINRSSDFYRFAVGTSLIPMKSMVDVKEWLRIRSNVCK